jgi:hypothetical protein
MKKSTRASRSPQELVGHAIKSSRGSLGILVGSRQSDDCHGVAPTALSSGEKPDGRPGFAYELKTDPATLAPIDVASRARHEPYGGDGQSGQLFLAGNRQASPVQKITSIGNCGATAPRSSLRLLPATSLAAADGMALSSRLYLNDPTDVAKARRALEGDGSQGELFERHETQALADDPQVLPVDQRASEGPSTFLRLAPWMMTAPADGMAFLNLSKALSERPVVGPPRAA